MLKQRRGDNWVLYPLINYGENLLFVPLYFVKDVVARCWIHSLLLEKTRNNAVVRMEEVVKVSLVNLIRPLALVLLIFNLLLFLIGQCLFVFSLLFLYFSQFQVHLHIVFGEFE